MNRPLYAAMRDRVLKRCNDLLSNECHGYDDIEGADETELKEACCDVSRTANVIYNAMRCLTLPDDLGCTLGRIVGDTLDETSYERLPDIYSDIVIRMATDMVDLDWYESHATDGMRRSDDEYRQTLDHASVDMDVMLDKHQEGPCHV